MVQRLLVFVSLAILTGCNGMKPEEFAGQGSRLVLEDYFEGQTRAWGIFEDRFGNLRRQFTVDIEGTWDGERLTLIEDFVFADGEIDQRIWRIRKIDDHNYEGQADDVVGVAKGRAYGNALNWQYRMLLKVGDSEWNVGFDDWMFLQEDGVLINRASVSKLGFEIGRVTLFFKKAEAEQQQQQSAVILPGPGARPRAFASGS